MSVVVRPAAAADIDDAYLWYERQSPGLGEAFLLAVDAAKQRIATNPTHFPWSIGTRDGSCFPAFLTVSTIAFTAMSFLSWRACVGAGTLGGGGRDEG